MTATRVHVLLISDTHGAVDARIVQLASECDYVLHAGDVGGGNVLNALGATAKVLAVRGNNDVPAKWPASDRAALGNIAEHLTLELPGGTLVVTHADRVRPASKRHECLRRLYPHARAVVYGHTHRLAIDCERVPWVLNPGAGGRVRTYGGPSCLVLDAGKRGWRVRAIRFPIH